MLKNLARWAVRGVPAGVHLPILRGPLRGRWWVVGASAGAGRGLSVLFHPMEEREMRAAEALAPRDGVVFDIGANVGMYSLLLARRCRRVFAFEPVPRNIRFLVRVLEANRVENVVVVPVAVSDGLAMTGLREGANHALASLDGAGRQPAVTVSCDAFAARYGEMPGLLKIDVEGAEAAVLRGARRLLAERRPVVLLSTHSAALEAECLGLMRAAGYPPPSRLSEDPLNGGAGLLFAVRRVQVQGIARPPAPAAARV